MTDSMRIARSLGAVILLGAALRLGVCVAAGIAAWGESGDAGYPKGVSAAGAVLLTFGNAGDGVGVLLGLAALALVWWLLVTGEPAEGLRSATAGVLGLTALFAFVQGLGSLLLYSIAVDETLWIQLIQGVGLALVYALVALGALNATRSVATLARTGPAERFGDDPLVFAVDRADGEVHAYLSVDEAARKTHAFSVDDDELHFFTDEGKVVRPSVENDRVVLQPTDVDQRDELLKRLRAFVVRRGIHVHEQDADDPTAYAEPIRTWQWLELWPGWLRWMGRMIRPR